MIKGDRIKLVKKMGVFDNIGEICEVTDIQEGGVICFKFGGCHLGCMSYDEYKKYFEKVETPVKRTWSEWSDYHILYLTDLLGIPRSLSWQYRYNGKKIQVRSSIFKVETTCYKNDTFDLNKGLNLAKKRLIVKYLDNQVKSIAKAM